MLLEKFNYIFYYVMTFKLLRNLLKGFKETRDNLLIVDSRSLDSEKYLKIKLSK